VGQAPAGPGDGGAAAAAGGAAAGGAGHRGDLAIEATKTRETVDLTILCLYYNPLSAIVEPYIIN